MTESTRIYTGPLARGVIADGDRLVSFERGVPVELSADAVLDDNWSTPKPPKSTPKPKGSEPDPKES